jgi:hypothetical protein
MPVLSGNRNRYLTKEENMAREVVVENEFYTLEVDTTTNRTLSTYHGFWPDSDDFKNKYISDVQKMAARVRSGFTSMVDIRDFKVPLPGVVDAIVRVQEILIKAGVRKSARVSDQPIQSIMANRVGREADIKEDTTRMFNSVPEALTWLDS